MPEFYSEQIEAHFEQEPALEKKPGVPLSAFILLVSGLNILDFVPLYLPINAFPRAIVIPLWRQ